MAFTRVNSLCGPRKPAGRHIMVLATQPQLCDKSHNCGHIDRQEDVNLRDLLRSDTLTLLPSGSEEPLSRWTMTSGRVHSGLALYRADGQV